jgi:tetratricopeptide (TPR) repeat protein
MVGLKHQAHTRLNEAEDALSKADDQRDAIGGYDRTAFLFHVSHVLYEEKDVAGSVKALKQSIRLQPEQERQGRVHAYALLAQRQLRLGHLDAACESWSRFLDEYEHVSSHRGDDHFRTMRTELRRHPAARPVQQLALRARELATAKAA